MEVEKSEPEKKFIDLLKNSGTVAWWWKNGDEHMQENFGIKIDEKGKTFQPDFIVRYTDGTIGIYDTKPIGDRVDDTKVKAEALQNYIKKQKKVAGGIVIFENGVAKVNSEEVYRDFRECAEDWADFSR